MERFTVKGSGEYVAPRLQPLSVMDKKIPALTKAFQRIARVHPETLIIASMTYPATKRFVALFKARNRRTRVLMRRAQRMEHASVIESIDNYAV